MDTAEDFITLVQSLVELIIAHHKQTQLPKDPWDPIPQELAEAEAYLIRIVCPFLPSEETNQCAHHNAKNWTKATLETLQEHYLRIIDNITNTIQSLLVPDWERAFLVASRRAKNNTPQIKTEALNSTYDLLCNIMSPSFPPSKPKNKTSSTTTSNGEISQKSNTLESGNKGNRKRKSPAPSTNLDENQDNPPEENTPDSDETIIAPTKPPQPPPLGSSTPRNNPFIRLRPLSPIVQIANNTPLQTPTQGPPLKKRYLTFTDLEPLTTTSLANYHPHHGNKQDNWSLKVERKIIIMGDSNIGRLPHIPQDHIQTDCFPGAKINHAVKIINQTPVEPKVTTVILSFGLNDKETSNFNLIKNSIETLLTVAEKKFPNAVIYMPLINYSNHLPPQTQKNIDMINDIMKSKNFFIPKLDRPLFKTTPDNIHWTQDTAKAIRKYWLDFLE